jgi:putative oxygen-independent coproporphyrinogen III oxidase
MLLYIHVPFCRRKCHYCAFSSHVYAPELEQTYLEALELEASVRGEQVKGRKISSIYIGGGTPTLLSIHSLARVIELARSRFSIDSGIEFTIEANPETILEKKFPSDLKKLGVNRFSLGVQSLDDTILTSLGRGHTSIQAMKAAEIVREAGIDNLSLDLIWGLPGQTLEKWLEDLGKVVSLGPKHISCYGLTLEQGTLLELQVQRKEIELPEDYLQARMYVLGADYLESRGFQQYEVSNFARQGYLCVHNAGYWEGHEFLGLGPSGVSCVAGFRWKNPDNIDGYLRQAQGSFKGLEMENIMGRERINERIMLSLRTSRGLRLGEYSELTGKDFLDRFGDLVNSLCRNKLAVLSSGRLSLTRTGMLVSNSIIERFIS